MIRSSGAFPVVVAAVAATLFFGGLHAQASTADTQGGNSSGDSITVSSTSGDSDVSTTVTIEFDKPISAKARNEATTKVQTLVKSEAVKVSSSPAKATPNSATPQGTYLKCNTGYTWWDSWTTYGTQRNCGSTAAAW